jgi:hypothetical protein
MPDFGALQSTSADWENITKFRIREACFGKHLGLMGKPDALN